jgi:hypothetical protein
MYYIYNNSKVQATQGWFGKLPYVSSKQKTTKEFAFALEFTSIKAAQTWLNRRNLPGLILKRKDI